MATPLKSGVAQLAAQPGDMDIDGSLIDDDVLAPDRIEQALPSRRLCPGSMASVISSPNSLGRSSTSSIANQHPPAVDLDPQSTTQQDNRWLSGRRGPPAGGQPGHAPSALAGQTA